MENNNINNRDAARVVGGLILVGIGTVHLLRNLGYFMPGWLFTWPVILILVGVYTAVRNNFRGSSWFILTVIGVAFLVANVYNDVNFNRAFWPVVVIAFGLMFILRPKRSGDCKGTSRREKMRDEYIASTDSRESADSSDFIYVNSVFSGVKKNMLSKNFQGGKINCVFGGAEVDFMQADINGTVTLRIELIFGGAKIMVPANWTIVNELDGMFHGVEDKRKNTIVLPDPSKTLLLKGSAVFGGVDIRSY